MIDWDNILPQTNDANAILDIFLSKLSNVIDKHVPLKKLTKKEIKFKLELWITPGLRVSTKKKNWFKKYCQNKSSFYAYKYKKYRNS